MATVKLVIKKKATKSDGSTPIYLQYSYDSQIRTLIKTGFNVKPADWNFDKDEVRKSSPQSANINDKIKKYLRNVEDIILYAKNNGITPTTEFIKNEYQKVSLGIKPMPMERTFFDYFDEFVQVQQSKVSKGTISAYKTTKSLLEKYQKIHQIPLNFDSFNFAFYESFVNYLRNSVEVRQGRIGLKENTIGNNIKNLKAILTFCTKNK